MSTLVEKEMNHMRSTRIIGVTFWTLVFIIGWSDVFSPIEIIWRPQKAIAEEVKPTDGSAVKAELKKKINH